ncbi:hypothetical protein AMTRI_Chr01g114980 [Amborella trichopoda]
MASVVLRRRMAANLSSINRINTSYNNARGFAAAVGTDIVDSCPEVRLSKARSWDEGVSSKFSTTPLSQIFKFAFLFLCNHPGFWLLCRQGRKVVVFGLPGAFTGVCSAQHVPSYKNNAEKFKAKGVHSLVCVAVNDPYVMNGWAEKLNAKEDIDFYGDFDGSFNKSLDLGLDLSSALLGHRSQRWSAYVVDGKIQAFNVEKVPSEFNVSGGDAMLGQI